MIQPIRYRAACIGFAVLIVSQAFVSCPASAPPVTIEALKDAARVTLPPPPADRELASLRTFLLELEKHLNERRGVNVALSERIASDSSPDRSEFQRRALLDHSSALAESFMALSEGVQRVLNDYDDLLEIMGSVEPQRRRIGGSDGIVYREHQEQMAILLFRLASTKDAFDSALSAFDAMQSRALFDLRAGIPVDVAMKEYPRLVSEALLLAYPEEPMDATVESIDLSARTILIDKGQMIGVRPGYLFICENGVVGRVIDVQLSRVTARILSDPGSVVVGGQLTCW